MSNEKLPIGISGRIFGPEFRANGHIAILARFASLVSESCPSIISYERSDIDGRKPLKVVYFHQIAGSAVDENLESRVYRREFHDDYLLIVTYGISYTDVMMPVDEFCIVFSKLIFEATLSIIEYSKRKKIDLNHDLLLSTIRSVCNHLA